MQIDLEEYHSSLIEQLADKFESEKDFADFLEGPKFKSLLQETSDEMAEDFADAISQRCKKAHKIEKTQRTGFERRNNDRWKEGFDHLTALILCCSELGAAAVANLRLDVSAFGEAKLSALTSLHARCTRVAHEALSLMRCGYPDGAYARWRTMHEYQVTAMFIAQSDDVVATRYHHSRILKSFKAAVEYETHKDALGLRDFGSEELSILEQQATQIKKLYEDDLSGDWSWARPSFPNSSPNRKVNFAQIQEHVRMGHWQPYMRMAHQEIHAGFVPTHVGLGVSESEDDVLLVGASNSGMVDPGQNLAITLVGTTNILLASTPTLDTIAYMKALNLSVQKTIDALLIGASRTGPK